MYISLASRKETRMSGFQIKRAVRQKTKLKIGVFGTSGSGKTYSALKLARGLTTWDKIAVIDTENGSADLYAHLGEYNTLTLSAPFSPERYIEAIQACEKAGMEVIVIDSVSHEWDGTGGCLEIVDQLGGQFQHWKKVTPRHNKFIQAILQSPCHVIVTARKKQDYAMETENGKAKVRKVGLKEVTREGFEYELTLAFDLSINHLATASKDRTGLFMDKPEFVITEQTGEALMEWVEGGSEPVQETPTVKIEDGEFFDTEAGHYKNVDEEQISEDLEEILKDEPKEPQASPSPAPENTRIGKPGGITLKQLEAILQIHKEMPPLVREQYPRAMIAQMTMKEASAFIGEHGNKSRQKA